MTDQVTNRINALHAARHLVAKGWTQCVSARDAWGRRVEYNNVMACSWCARGAVQKIVGHNPSEITHELNVTLLELGQPNAIIAWNDEPGRTQAEVLALFDLTIERLSNA